MKEDVEREIFHLKEQQQLSLSQAKAESLKFHLGLQRGWQGPSTWAIFHFFLGHSSRNLGQKWSSRYLRIWDAGVTSCNLTHYHSAGPVLWYKVLICNHLYFESFSFLIFYCYHLSPSGTPTKNTK